MLKNNLPKKFIILAALSEILYLLFYLIEPWRKYLGDQKLTLHNNYLYFFVVGILLALLTLYFLNYWQTKWQKINFKIIVIFFIVFNLTTLFIWPIGAVDIFTYISSGRIISEYNSNPYINTYSQYSNDILYNDIKNVWSDHTQEYGPLFFIISSALTAIGNNSLSLTLFVFKLFFATISLLNLVILYKTLNSVQAAYLYAFNPLLIFEFAINAHNDVLTIFFLLLALFIFLKKATNTKNFILVWIFLILSFLIKYQTIVLLPLFYLIMLICLKNYKQKIYFIILSLFISLFITVILFYPFCHSWATFTSILLSRLKYNSLLLSSIFIVIISAILLYKFKLIILNNIPTGITKIFNIATVISRTLFIGLYSYVLLNIIRNFSTIKKNNVIIYSNIVLLTFFAFCLTWLMPWYLTLLITMLIYATIKENNLKIKNLDIQTVLIFVTTFYGIFFYFFLR